MDFLLSSFGPLVDLTFLLVYDKVTTVAVGIEDERVTHHLSTLLLFQWWLLLNLTMKECKSTCTNKKNKN